MRKIFHFLALNILAVPLVLSAADSSKPNVLFIVADDMGYSDLGCYGGEIKTPNLDGLAAGGLRFTQFYNTARCWSSRACILTGFYAQQVRRDNISGHKLPNTYGVGGAGGVRPRWAELLPEMLKPLGYHSYMSGKWHVDGNELDNGFEHDYEVAGGLGFFSDKSCSEDGKPLPSEGKLDGSYYSTVAIADHAIKYLKEHAEKYPKQPFFQYLAFHSPHFPIQALPEDIALYKGRYQAGWDVLRTERLERMKKLGIVTCDLSPLDPKTIPHWNLPEEKLKNKIGPEEVGYAVPWDTLTSQQKEFQSAKMSVHAAMVHRMDSEIGRVMNQIKSMGALDNTAVFFVSDNGASAEQIIRGLGEDPKAPIGSANSFLGIGPGWASLANTPFRLFKSWNHEGGISTPLIVSWPAGIKARGELRADPGHLIDLVPTVLELSGGKQSKNVAGLAVPPFPGLSLVPDFARDGMVKHDSLWWNHDGNRAIRVGDWKLVADHDKPWELYNMKQDRSETKNLAAAQPERVKDLEKQWNKNADAFHDLALQDPPTTSSRKKRGKAVPEE